MAAKVDSSLVQDGFQIYHHCFFFSRNGTWAVVQQGMNEKAVTARRYHWFSDIAKNMVIEPHSGIISDGQLSGLNMAPLESDNTREISTELVQGSYNTLMKDFQLLRKYSTPQSDVVAVGIGSKVQPSDFRRLNLRQELVKMHLHDRDFKVLPVVAEDFTKSKYLQKIL